MEVIPTLEIDKGPSFGSRIEGDLEQINTAVAEINLLSGEVHKARLRLRNSINAGKARLDHLYLLHQKWVEKARPYFRAKSELEKVQLQFQEVNRAYQFACLEFEDARENEIVAEKAFLERMDKSGYGGTCNTDVLANLNKANDCVQDRVKEKAEIFSKQEEVHEKLNACEKRVAKLQKDLKRPIGKAMQYFEERNAIEKQLQKQAKGLRDSQAKLKEAKDRYRVAFENLDVISAELEQRNCAIDIENSSRDLSKFEEIDLLEEHVDLEPRIRSPSMECMHSMDSLTISDTCETTSADASADDTDDFEPAADDMNHGITRSVSLDAVACRDVVNDPSSDPNMAVNGYAVTFQMEL